MLIMDIILYSQQFEPQPRRGIFLNTSFEITDGYVNVICKTTFIIHYFFENRFRYAYAGMKHVRTKILLTGPPTNDFQQITWNDLFEGVSRWF